MKTLKTVIAIVFLAGFLPFTAHADFEYPKLPWYEKYFFPVGVWTCPYYECVPDSTYVDPNPNDDWESPKADITWPMWNARFNAINFDEYHNLGLDFAKFQCYYHPYVKNPGDNPSPPHRTTYEKRFHAETGHAIPGLVETNRLILDKLSDLNLRGYVKLGDMSWIPSDLFLTRPPYYCWAGPCGGQGEEPVDDREGYDTERKFHAKWGYDYWDPDDYDDIYDHFDDQTLNYPNPFFPESNGPIYEDTIAQYEGYENLTALDIIDEPNIYEIINESILHDYGREHDVEQVLLQNIVDRTGNIWERIPPDVTNYYRYVVCHAGNDAFMTREYPYRHDMPPNSGYVYKGVSRQLGDCTQPYWSEYNPDLDHGYYGLEEDLKHSRETSVAHDIPFWHLPGMISHPGAGGVRLPTPREFRAETNMALTYGARGIVYYGLFKPAIFHNVDDEAVRYFPCDSLLDEDGDQQPGTYSAGTHDITYLELYNEVLDIDTKLHHVRNTLQTLTSLSALHSFDLDNMLPRGLIYDYEGNRTGRQWYQPDYTEETDFLDFGTFVCPHTGVRYFAVSDRFCNWPPATFPDPTEKDVATVRHPGRVITDVYYDLDDPAYSQLYFPIEGWDHDSGVSEFDFRLDNAEGRVFKLDPCLTLAPGFEWGENPGNVWDYDGGYGWIPTVVDDVSRKGNNSLRLERRESDGTWVVANEARLKIAGIGVGPFDVAPGATYRASAYIMADAGWDGYAKVQVVWYNQNDQSVGLLAETPSVSAGTNWAGLDGWVYTSVDFSVEDIPPTAVTIGLNLVLVGGTGNVWFDEVRLEPRSRIFNGHFEWGGGDYWFGPVHGWGWSFSSPQLDYERSSPGHDGDYCMRVGAVSGQNTYIRNVEKLYLGKGTNYVVTGWAKREPACPEAKVIVEFRTTKDVVFNVESYGPPNDGQWHPFTIPIAPNEWSEFDFAITPEDGKPAYVKIACKVAQGSGGSAYFDDIELVETNLVANGSFELAEEGPHWPDRWNYAGVISAPDPGDPDWSALYDGDAKYDRRCWRVRTPPFNIGYGSETFVLEPGIQYRLSGWLRNFDVEPYVVKFDGCKLKINLYDGSGTNLVSYETEEVRTSEEWTYKSVGIPADVNKRFARVVVVEEEDAYSSAADGIRVVPFGSVE